MALSLSIHLFTSECIFYGEWVTATHSDSFESLLDDVRNSGYHDFRDGWRIRRTIDQVVIAQSKEQPEVPAPAIVKGSRVRIMRQFASPFNGETSYTGIVRTIYHFGHGYQLHYVVRRDDNGKLEYPGVQETASAELLPDNPPTDTDTQEVPAQSIYTWLATGNLQPLRDSLATITPPKYPPTYTLNIQVLGKGNWRTHGKPGRFGSAQHATRVGMQMYPGSNWNVVRDSDSTVISYNQLPPEDDNEDALPRAWDDSVEESLAKTEAQEAIVEQPFEIMASQIGFEFEPDIRIKINREPQTAKEWEFVSEFVSETFPLTTDDISHGYSRTSCKIQLPDPEPPDHSVPVEAIVTRISHGGHHVTVKSMGFTHNTVTHKHLVHLETGQVWRVRVIAVWVKGSERSYNVHYAISNDDNGIVFSSTPKLWIINKWLNRSYGHAAQRLSVVIDSTMDYAERECLRLMDEVYPVPEAGSNGGERPRFIYKDGTIGD